MDWKEIQLLVESGAVESDILEFKREPPSNSKDRPGWDPPTGKLLDYARNSLLEETIAFANGGGGTLIIGISESDDIPHRATAIVSVAGSADLANRLNNQVRDCVEPPLHSARFEALRSPDDKQELVIATIGASPSAPHRLKASGASKEAYVRRNDRCETMTMREIQETTIARRSASARLEARAELARREWRTTLNARYSSMPNDAVIGIWIHCSPIIEDLELPEVDNIQQLFQSLPTPRYRFGAGHFEAGFPGLGWNFAHVLGGIRCTSEDPGAFLERTMYRTGIVEYRYSAKAYQARPILFPNWLIFLTANAVRELDLLRTASRAPSTEYAIRINIDCSTTELPLGLLGGMSYGETRLIRQLPLDLGPYSISASAGSREVVAVLLRDVTNAAGRPFRMEEFDLTQP